MVSHMDLRLLLLFTLMLLNTSCSKLVRVSLQTGTTKPMVKITNNNYEYCLVPTTGMARKIEVDLARYGKCSKTRKSHPELEHDSQARNTNCLKSSNEAVKTRSNASSGLHSSDSFILDSYSAINGPQMFFVIGIGAVGVKSVNRRYKKKQEHNSKIKATGSTVVGMRTSSSPELTRNGETFNPSRSILANVSTSSHLVICMLVLLVLVLLLGVMATFIVAAYRVLKKPVPDVERPTLSVDFNCIQCIPEDLKLTSIPEDLLDFLIKTLDITTPSWKALGLEMGIPKIDVEYLEVEYKREGGSPTRCLLLNAGAKGKTLRDLILALSCPAVGRRDIANCIQENWLALSQFDLQPISGD